MRLGRNALTLILIFTTTIFFMPAAIHADETAQPTTSITKHTPEVHTSPEIGEKSGHRWLWWTLGVLVLVGGIAAAAGGGGGGGGGSKGTASTTHTGSATVTW